MQFIFHPVTGTVRKCSVQQGMFNTCNNPARYAIDKTQADLVATIIEVGNVDGEWIATKHIEVCLHHAGVIIRHDHASFVVKPQQVTTRPFANCN